MQSRTKDDALPQSVSSPIIMLCCLFHWLFVCQQGILRDQLGGGRLPVVTPAAAGECIVACFELVILS